MESQDVVIRDFRLEDLDRVKELHEASNLDYRFPDIQSPLFIVVKVLERNGIIQACGGLYVQVEAYLWISQDGWKGPSEKLDAIRILDREVLHEAWMKGIDEACLYLPPDMDRFGQRLEDMGWSRDRDGWKTFSKRTA